MKKQSGIWIDSAKAVIIHLLDEGEEVMTVESSIDNKIHHQGEGDKGVKSGTQWVNREKKYDERRKNQTKAYLQEVIQKVEKSNIQELYIFGPTTLKSQLKKMIEQKNTLSGMRLFEDTADSMTDNQLVRQVKIFFDRHQRAGR